MKNFLWTALFLLTVVSFTSIATANDDSVPLELINKVILNQNSEHYDNQLTNYFKDHSKDLITVENVKKLEVGKKVLLQGKIIEKLASDHKYLFRDDTGDIELKIDNNDLGGYTIRHDVTYGIWGELVRVGNKLEIDVNRIINN